MMLLSLLHYPFDSKIYVHIQDQQPILFTVLESSLYILWLK